MVKRNSDSIWLGSLWIIFGLVLVSLFHSNSHQPFNIDEFEHIHTAWKILQGSEIYVDFFQHHHPFLHYCLLPIINIYGETTDTLFAGRFVMVIISLLILVVTYLLSKRVFKKSDIALISLILTITLFGYYRKSVEIRPDVPQALFGLLSIYFLFVYYEKKTILSLIASAVFLSVSFLFLQKSIFLGFIIGLFFLYDLYRGKVTLNYVLLYFLVILACLSPYYLYLLSTGQFQDYFLNNWLVNMYYTGTPIPKMHFLIRRTIVENTLTLLLYSIGLLLILKNKINIRFAIMSLLLIVTVVLFLVPGRRQFIICAPLVGIIASYGLVNIFKHKLLRLIILILAISVPVYIMHGGGLFSAKNNKLLTQIDRINLGLRETNRGDKVYDPSLFLNLYRDDIDYFWFCLKKNKCLDTYQLLTGYHYDIYELIEAQKPKLISTLEIENLNDPRIRDYYEFHHESKNIMIRKD